jgi:hypothetical protein
MLPAALLAAAVLVPAAPALAATITPTRGDDPAGAGNCPADCSLRQAIVAAGPGGTVSLAPPAPPAYVLSQGGLTISSPLTIAGPINGAATITATSAVSAPLITGATTGLTVSNVRLTGAASALSVSPSSSAMLIDSTIDHMSGIAAGASSSATLRVIGSSIVNNASFGVTVAGATVEISDSTIADNASFGLSVAGATTTIASSTISANGSFNISAAGGTLAIHNSIFSGATTDNCSFAGVTVTESYNVEDANTCNFTGTGDQTTTNPLLEPLANYGGPTDTLALPANSPAVDMGDPAGCKDADGNLLLTDQRGAQRAANGRCDVGAFEYLPPPANTGAPAIAGSSLVGSTLTCGTGAWSGGLPLSFTYRWLQDGSPLAGATASTLTSPAGAIGHAIACVVTAANFTANASAESAPLTITAPPPKVLPLVRPGFRLLGSAIKLTFKGRGSTRLSCTTAGPCKLAAKLTVTVTLRRRGHKPKRVNIVVGSATTGAIATSKTGNVTIVVNRNGLALLKPGGKLSVSATGTVSSSATLSSRFSAKLTLRRARR